MPLNHRILKDNNGTIEDKTLELNSISESTVTLDWVALEDKLLIGSPHPFNHRYVEVDTANANAATITSVEVWDGTAWQSCVDVLDGTSSGGVTLAQSGLIRWTPDRDEGWTLDDSEDMGTPISTVKIYDLYWARLTFSADLSAGTILKYVGQRFATDEQLGSLYPELQVSDSKTQWEAGKTDWNEQLVLASEMVVRDLAFKKVLWDRNQVLDDELFSTACVFKTAQIIFTAWGNNYERDRDEARRRYDEELAKISNFKVDRNQDARIGRDELSTSTVVRRR